MLLVRASLRPSPIQGLGCFAEEAISRGQRVWAYDGRIDRRIPVADLPLLPPSTRAFLEVYGFVEWQEGVEMVVLCGDHAKHMNHAADPNVINDHEDNIAARDILPGEELTCDYYSFDQAAGAKLGR